MKKGDQYYAVNWDIDPETLKTEVCLDTYQITKIKKIRCIVNMSSTSALAGLPYAAAYGASKAGVLALTSAIAIEYGKRGVRANAICPGSIETPMTKNPHFPEGIDMKLMLRAMPLDQFRGPETVASLVAFLASEDAAHINGERVRVDGATLS